MSPYHNENRPELPLSVKVINGYIEQIDRLAPSLVKGSQDYRQVCISIHGMITKKLDGLVDAGGRTPPFYHTVSDVSSGALDTVLSLQCGMIEGGVRAYRKAAETVRDSLDGKRTT